MTHTNQEAPVNTISVKRDVEGRRYEATARYAAEVDGWYCSIGSREKGKLTLHERRGPVNDAWAEIQDMMELAGEGSYERVDRPDCDGDKSCLTHQQGKFGSDPKRECRKALNGRY